MTSTPNTQQLKALLLTASLLTMAFHPGWGESLFRTGAEYRTSQSINPPSIFTPPTPKNVGDIVTIRIEENASLVTNGELKVTRTQVVNQTGGTIFNNMIKFFATKLPIGRATVDKYLQAPVLTGINNSNVSDSKAESTRITTLTDQITCQVVQILPNGFLMVQGKKTSEVNRDRQDLFVSGIINPYYLDGLNTISSTKVGNFQIMQAGKGTVSRQQSDGVANKVLQFFN